MKELSGRVAAIAAEVDELRGRCPLDIDSVSVDTERSTPPPSPSLVCPASMPSPERKCSASSSFIDDEASEASVEEEDIEAYENDDFIVDGLDVELIIVSSDDEDDEDYCKALKRECGVKRALSFSGERQGKRRRRC